MAQDHCFDIVSNVNRQELRNALQQAQRELGTRFDFKDSRASLEFDEASGTLRVTADHHVQLKSVTEVFEAKLAKRGVSLKAFAWHDPEQLPSGGLKRSAELQQGLSSEKAKDITSAIKALGLKVQPRIEGERVRVSGKQIDELQAVIQTLKARDFGVPLQVENYR